MVIIITLAVLFGLFFVVRKHIGPAHLAVIAGLSVYEAFGEQFAGYIQRLATGVSLELIQNCLFLVFVLAFPLILYLRSYRGGLSGILRVAEAVMFAALLTLLIAPALSFFFSFDGLSHQIVGFIEGYRGIIVLVGVLTAYFDILMYHD